MFSDNATLILAKIKNPWVCGRYSGKCFWRSRVVVSEQQVTAKWKQDTKINLLTLGHVAKGVMWQKAPGGFVLELMWGSSCRWSLCRRLATQCLFIPTEIAAETQTWQPTKPCSKATYIPWTDSLGPRCRYSEGFGTVKIYCKNSRITSSKSFFTTVVLFY